MTTPSILPLPNGRMNFSTFGIPLPQVLRVDPGPFDPALVAVFAQRAGVALTQEGTPLLRLYRNPAFPMEAYRLRITEAGGIQAEASTEQGLSWALATLYALTEHSNWLPCCDITDQPRYSHRGILLDSARHFFPVGAVKQFIEALSLVKINTLHWHLSDDQGWRIESKRVPALHEQFAPEYYTQEQIREIVAFARLRGIEIVPEIDLPGHSTSILSVFPALSCSGKEVQVSGLPGIYSTILCAGKEAVFELLLPLLEEIAELFPSPRFHLGGDEAPKGQWEACPHCRQRMAQEGIATTEDLQGWFTARLAEHLGALGKRVICWNESLLASNLADAVPDLTAQYWAEIHEEGPSRRFWESGGRMIFSDYLCTYLDQPHGLVPMKTVYQYEARLPYFSGTLPAEGIEACVWTEFIPTPERLAEMAFPRAYALAEAAWTQPARKHYPDFRRRLDHFLLQNPGMGFTPPALADPPLPLRYQERYQFLRMQAQAERPEDSAGIGGSIDPKYSLRWLKFALL